MARKVCPQCLRPEKVCVCDFIRPVANSVEIAILQHPSESNQVKGTAVLARLGLANVRFWTGETFTELPELQNWLQEDKPTYLLYPPTEADNQKCQTYLASELRTEPFENIRVLVLDGTWRKTYKMMKLNPELQKLPRVAIEPESPSSYQIRKQKNQQSLSTVEAIVELLSELEGDTQKFQPLLDAFSAMQQQQLAFRK